MRIWASNRKLRCVALLILSTGPAPCADDMAYMIAGTQFGTIDLNTGAFTLVGNQTVQLVGLGVTNGRLYGAAGGTLYQVNLANGSLTKVGISSTNYTFFGSTLSGLYAAAAGNLYSIDPGTGAATQIGNGILPQTCVSGQLSTNSAALYFSCNTQSLGKANLYTIDVSSGRPTLIGSEATYVFLYALTSINGTLYGGLENNASGTFAGSVASVNPANAALTIGPSLKGASGLFSGLAPLIQSPAPTINPDGVVPVFSPSNIIQPGSWVSIYGTNFAGATNLWAGDFPKSLGGVTVTVNSKPAYLWYVNPGQINLQSPDDTASGTVPVVVTTASGSATSTVTLAQFGPSFSLLDTKHVTGIILRSNGSGAYNGGAYDILGPTGTSLGYSTVAAKAGDSVVLFGVGFGPTSPPVSSGQIFSGSASTTNAVKLLINNVSVTPSFAGLSSAGLYQVNLTVPAGLGTGDVPLVATVGGVQTPSSVVIPLQ
jgi:uncharacterized protein (TIGR03437 family)